VRVQVPPRPVTHGGYRETISVAFTLLIRSRLTNANIARQLPCPASEAVGRLDL
jgi:hypothetical protein